MNDGKRSDKAFHIMGGELMETGQGRFSSSRNRKAF